MEITTIVLLIAWFISAGVAMYIGNKKGELVTSIFVGILLGPLGLIMSIASVGNWGECTRCGTQVKRKAAECPHCGKEFD